MSLTNPNTVVTEQRLNDFYKGILPYLGGMPEMVANKFSKGDIYSTDEKMIGQWVDGKPIYQKTVDVTVPTTTDGTVATGYADVSSLNIDNNISIFGIGQISNGAACVLFASYFATNSGYFIKALIDDNKSHATVHTNCGAYSNNTYKVIIQYTKTTDSPISIGSETEYSTDEKVVGTWITGEPIYQKTVYNTTLSSIPNNNWVTYCTIENLKDLILFKFMRAKNDGGTLGVFNDICGSTNGSNVTCISRTTALTLDYSKSYAILQYTKSTT